MVVLIQTSLVYPYCYFVLIYIYSLLVVSDLGKCYLSREMHRDQKYVLYHGIMMSFQLMPYLYMALSITRQKTIPLLMLHSQVDLFVIEVHALCISGF